MATTLLALALALSLATPATAHPSPKILAGAPSITDISACTLTNISPSTNATTTYPGWDLSSLAAAAASTNTSFAPSPAFTQQNVFYTWVTQLPGLNSTANLQTCLEQCHGYQGCVAVAFAHNATRPPSARDDTIGDVCYLSGVDLLAGDLGSVAGGWLGAFALNLAC